jgi:hypothetical protein
VISYLDAAKGNLFLRKGCGSADYFAVLNIVDEALPVILTRFNDQPEALRSTLRSKRIETASSLSV